MPLNLRRKIWLRKTLRYSQQEAVASSAMIATGDNFFNAFAVHLNATAIQMGWLSAIPQLMGGIFQIISVWIGQYIPRRPMVVVAAVIQALVVFMLAILATDKILHGVYVLIMLAAGYFALMNFIQPQWRAWMGSIVPARRRGTFFARRTRFAQISSLTVFFCGGVLLSWTAGFGKAALGFALVFSVAAMGRLASAWLLSRMHDPDPRHTEIRSFGESIDQCMSALRDPVFRHYSIFVAGMTGVVAISAPFFAVYMLRDLEFTYLQYSLNHITSIVVQFLALSFWGRFSDQYGNRLVMLLSASIIPILPIIWTLSPDFYYLLGVQAISGFAWSGFTLSTANYLYDIRPHRTNFAVYAAVQSGLGALAVFCGGIAGGYLASYAPNLLQISQLDDVLRSPLFIVFFVSSLFRALILLWFIPRSVEPKIRKRPEMLQLVLRVARFNAVSGVAFDWLTIKKKSPGKKDRH